LSVEQTVRQMINNELRVSDVMILVNFLSHFLYNIVRLTKLFEVFVLFCMTLQQVKSILFKLNLHMLFPH